MIVGSLCSQTPLFISAVDNYPRSFSSDRPSTLEMAPPIEKARKLNNEVVEALRVASSMLKKDKAGRHLKLRHLEKIAAAQNAATAAFEIRDKELVKAITAIDVGKVKSEREREENIRAAAAGQVGLK